VIDRYDPSVSGLEEPLTVTVEGDGDEVVLVLVGELDPHTAPLLRAAIDGALGERTSSLVLDVAGLGFIDSSGLRVVISAHKEMDERQGRLALRSPTPNTRRLLEITGLADYVDVS
jgi:anti-anti-sigma factor